MENSNFYYTLRLKDQTRPGYGKEKAFFEIVTGFNTFERINTLIAIVDRANARLEKKLGRKVGILPTLPMFKAMAECEEPYRALFFVEWSEGVTYRFREWDSFPLAGDGAKRFLGGDFFVVLVDKEGEQHIECAAFDYERERLSGAIRALWDRIVNADLMGEPQEPVCPAIEFKGAVDTDSEEAGKERFDENGPGKFEYDFWSEEGHVSYTAEIVPEENPF